VRLGALLMVCLVGCSSEGVAPTEPPTPETLCGSGALELDDGSCLEPGIQLNGCPAGTHAGEGGCLPPGIPQCVDGFAWQDQRCVPILPAAACAAGEMALPGETTCRVVADCGRAPWGNIAIDPGTIFVDAAYVGGNSDGSMATPWTSIVDALAFAPQDAAIAIAEGTYVGDLVAPAAVRLMGRCPQLVRIEGAVFGAESAAISLPFGGAVSGVSVTGLEDGIVALDDAIIANVWVHGTGLAGIVATSIDMMAVIRVTDSLVEGSGSAGIVGGSGSLQILRTEVRDTASVGILVASDEAGLHALMMDQVVVSDVAAPGVFFSGRGLEVAGSVVQRVRYNEALDLAAGMLLIQGDHPEPMVVRDTVIRNCVGFGVALLGGTLDAERISIASTTSHDGVGTGLSASQQTAWPVQVNLVDSVIEANDSAAVGVHMAVGDVSRSLLVGAADDDGLGWGGFVASDGAGSAVLTIRQCAVQGARSIGLLVNSGDLVLEGSSVTATRFGDDVSAGISLIEDDGPSNLLVSRSAIVDSEMFGILGFDGAVTIDGTLVRDVVPAADGLFGDAVALVNGAPGSDGGGQITNSRLQAATRVGAMSFGVAVGVANSRIECNGIALSAADVSAQAQAQFQDLGANRCGCGDALEVCAVRRTMVSPPVPPDASPFE
jgi:hypothetical protein